MKPFILMLVGMLTYLIYLAVLVFRAPIEAIERSAGFMRRFESKRY